MPRGSKPGERRGGRKPGIPNKATAEIKDIARKLGPKAVETLAKLAGLVPGAKAAESEQARIGALNSILDRGYGKPAQAIVGDTDAPPIQHAVEVTFVGASQDGEG